MSESVRIIPAGNDYTGGVRKFVSIYKQQA